MLTLLFPGTSTLVMTLITAQMNSLFQELEAINQPLSRRCALVVMLALLPNGSSNSKQDMTLSQKRSPIHL